MWNFWRCRSFSLQTNKALFAGEGGILVTNNKEIHDRATLIGHYRDRSREEIETDYQKYWESGFGLKLRMSPFNAIVAKHSLANFHKRKAGRYQCLNYFIERLKGNVGFIEVHEPQGDVDMGAWYGFKPLYKKEKFGGVSRKTLIKALHAEGLEISAPSGQPLCLLSLYAETLPKMFSNAFKSRIPNVENYPITMKVNEEGLSLPTFYDWENSKDLIDLYIAAFQKVKLCQKELKEYDGNNQ